MTHPKKVVVSASINGFVPIVTSWGKPDSEGYDQRTINETRQKAEDIAAQIRRHCDVERGAVSVNVKIEDQCPFCGHVWSPDKRGVNGCCEQHILEWESEHPGQEALE